MNYYILNKFPIKENNGIILTSRIVLWKESLSDNWKDMATESVINNISLYDLIFNPTSKVLDIDNTLTLEYIVQLHACISILISHKAWYTKFDNKEYKSFLKFLYKLYDQLKNIYNCNNYQIYVGNINSIQDNGDVFLKV